MIARVGEITVVESGAKLRVTGSGPDAVVCVNGGGRAEVPGTWSATVEWLVERLALRFPRLRFGEVRYRIKSWRRLDLCVEDGLASIAALEPRRTLMLGFSMGGTVSVRLGAQPSVGAKSSRHAYERAVARGIDASYTTIRGGLHGAALRAPGGRTLPLPRARVWLNAVASEVERFRHA
jgi:pimeloyl-ACP methyl ester carboxylesterase